MTADLSRAANRRSECFVPDRDRGRLIEAEHLARYRWAAQVAPGRVVLDAGCGTAYGTRLLAEAGATEVTGVDAAESVLEVAAPSMPDTVRLEPGDLRRLSHDDDRFELIVCLEVIQHVDEPDAVLDELVRVLAPGGLLLVSLRNRAGGLGDDLRLEGEMTPTELETALAARLAHVRLMRQHDYLVSAVLSDATYAAEGADAVAGLSLDKLVAGQPGEELFVAAVASDAPLPDLRELGSIGGPLELAGWIEAARLQDAAIHDRDDRIAQLHSRVTERDQIAHQLTDAEQRAAALPALRARIEELELALAAANEVLESSRAETRRLDERLMSSERVLREVFRSPSWQVTKPLRCAKRRLKG